MFIGIALLLLLTNIIFDVEVVHNKKEIQELLISELKKYGITERRFIKSFKDVEKIKEEILNKYKDKLEWSGQPLVHIYFYGWIRVWSRCVVNGNVLVGIFSSFAVFYLYSRILVYLPHTYPYSRHFAGYVNFF